MATALGDSRYNNRLDDDSPQFHLAEQKQNRDFLARFEALNPTGLSSQDALSREIDDPQAARDYRGRAIQAVGDARHPRCAAIHLSLIEMGTFMPFKTVGDYENYVARLHQVRNAFEQNHQQYAPGNERPPHASALSARESKPRQAEDLASKSGESSPFAKPVQAFPANIAPARGRRACARPLLAALDGENRARLQEVCGLRAHRTTRPRAALIPASGRCLTAQPATVLAIRRMTTTDLSPEQIHEIGVKQLAETEAEMLTLAHQLGFKDLASLNEHIKNDRTFYATSRGAGFLTSTPNTRGKWKKELPKLFKPPAKEQACCYSHGFIPVPECRARRLHPGSARTVRAPGAST